jgi:hypothetical protein
MRRRAHTSVPPPTTPLLLVWLLVAGCGGTAHAPAPVAVPAAPPATTVAPPSSLPAFTPTAAQVAFLDDLEERTFRWFWELADPHTGLVPDRWPTKAFASVAATGFGLTAYPIGVERGFVTREQARDRVLSTLRFLWQAPQGPQRSGVAGYKGFFYHFLVEDTGMRFETVELSTIDTTLLLGGVLVCGEYFDRDDAPEREIRKLARDLYERVEWDWVRPRPPRVGMGWKPEGGYLESDWHGYDEAMLLYIMALGSPTHPVDPAAWEAWTSSYRFLPWQGQEYVAFAPLFGHQYSHLFIDFRGIQDAYMRGKGLDYFENSRRATLAQRQWAIANPRGWEGLGADVWGVSACDGPADLRLPVHGEQRLFFTYAGRGVGADFMNDDGTLTPTAAGGSVPFAPEVAIPALVAMRERYGEPLYARYGFLDAFNPTFRYDVPVHHGRVVPGVGWFDTDYLGIDQGPILGMVENYRSGLVWRLMRNNPDLRRGLERAGFRGGWLEGQRAQVAPSRPARALRLVAPASPGAPSPRATRPATLPDSRAGAAQ